MFTCLNKHTNEHLTSLSKRWRGREVELRKLGRSDCLVCSYCKELLTFRCGQVTRPHFAHRHASKCPLDGKRSPEEVEAKAQLYEVLEHIWDGEVRMDALLEGESQPIDILLIRDDSPFAAYGILSKSIRKFEIFSSPANNRGIPFHILYTGDAHKRSDDQIILQKQQRDLIDHTKQFDSCERPNHGHLSFIDSDSSELLIYRGLICQHAPNGYSFDLVRQSSLNAISIHTNGELITPEDVHYAKGYEDRLQRVQLEIDRRKEEIRQQEIARVKAAQAEIKRQQEAKQRTCIYCQLITTPQHWSIELPCRECVCTKCLPLHNEKQARVSVDFTEKSLDKTPPPKKTAPAYTCECCGKYTCDWGFCSPGKNTCVCNSCLPTYNQSIQW